MYDRAFSAFTKTNENTADTGRTDLFIENY